MSTKFVTIEIHFAKQYALYITIHSRIFQRKSPFKMLRDMSLDPLGVKSRGAVALTIGSAPRRPVLNYVNLIGRSFSTTNENDVIRATAPCPHQSTNNYIKQNIPRGSNCRLTNTVKIDTIPFVLKSYPTIVQNLSYVAPAYSSSVDLNLGICSSTINLYKHKLQTARYSNFVLDI